MADIKFLNNISLENLQLKNAKIQVVSTDPVLAGASYEGRIIYNSNDNSIKFHNGSNSDYWVKLDGVRFWNLGTASNSIFTTKMASIGQDANIVNSKLNVYKTEDMTASVPHIATFNESSSNHSANLWPNSGDNSADIYGSISRGTFTGTGSVDQIKGAELIGRHSGSGSVNFIQGSQSTASLTGSGSTEVIAASYAKAFIAGTGSNNIENAIGAWNTVELNGLNDVDHIFGTYSNLALTKGEVNDEAIGHYINFQQVAADTEINNAYYIHAKNDSLSVTGEKFFIKDETGIPSQFSNKLVLNAYGSGTFTGTATQRLAVDTNGNVIEIPIGSGPVDGSGTANYTARWTDSDTLGTGALYDNGTQVGIGTNNPDTPLHVVGNVKIETTGSVDNLLLTSTDATLTGAPDISLFADTAAADGDTIGNIQFRGRNGMVPGSTAPLTYAAFYSHIIDKDNNQSILALTGHKGNGSGANKTVANFSVIGTNNSGEGAVLINPSSGYTPSSYNLEVNGDFKVVDDASFDSNVGVTGSVTANSFIGNLLGNVNGNVNGSLVNGSLSNIISLSVTGTGDSYFAGNVGIGTTSPGYKLEVSGNSLVTGTQFIGDTFTKIQQAGGNLLFSNLSSSGGIEFRTNSTEKMRILANGNVGIGTTSPSYKLHIAQGEIGISNLSPGFTNPMGVIGAYNQDANNGGLLFKTIQTSTVSERMRILANGNVGIGTTNPTKKLHVNGEAFFQNTVSLPDNAYIGLGSSFDFHLSHNGSSSSITNSTGNLNISSNGGDAVFNTASTERLRITSSGNVGIGTTSPSEKLSVAGNLSTFHSGYTTKALRVTMNSNDTLLSLYSRANQSSQQVLLRTNGNSYLNGGNVGIGTTSPDSLLEISTTDATKDFIKLTSGGGSVNPSLIFEKSTAEQGVIQYIRNGDLKIYNTDNDGGVMLSGSGATNYDVYINNSGNVGIGTTSPQGKLDISTASSSDIFNLRIHNLAGETSQSTGILFNTGYTDISRGKGGLVYEYDTSAGWNRGDFHFLQRQDGGSGIARLSDSVVTIKNNGNVGIGTTSPTSKLHIAASDPRIKIVDTDGTNWESQVFTQGGALKLQARNGTNFGNISFQGDNGTTQQEYARFNSVGRLGIGTTSPNAKLDVTGSGTIVYAGGTASNNEIVIERTTSSPSKLQLQAFSSNPSIKFTANGNGRLRFLDSSDNERVTFLENGNVGIGTTNPTKKLDVAGAMNLALSPVALRVGGTAVLGILNNFTRVNGTGGASGGIVFTPNNDNNEKVRITGTGNVGIGTTSPSSKLHIEDSISNGSLFKITTSTAGSLQPVFDARVSSNGDTYYDFNAYKSSTKKIQIKSANTSYIQQVDGTGGFNIKGYLSTSLQTVNGGGVLQLHRYGALSLNNDESYAHTPASALYINTFYNTSTNYLMLLANQGNDKLAVDLNGNVGIGTTSPNAKLHLSDSASGGNPSFILQDNARSGAAALNYILLTDSLNANQAKIGYLSGLNTDLTLQNLVGNTSLVSSGQIKVTAGTNTLFENSGSEKMRILASGNVGIGTTSPSEKLEVAGQYGNTTLRGHAIGFTRAAGNYLWAKTSGGDLRFTVNGNPIGSPSMIISNSGNVGIGTTSPSYPLEIAQTGYGLGVKNYITSTDVANSILAGYDPAAVYLGYGYGSKQVHIGSLNSGDVKIRTQGNTIVENGNVGIGTTSPSYGLDIHKSSNAFRVANSGGYTKFDVNPSAAIPTKINGRASAYASLVSSNNYETLDGLLVQGYKAGGNHLAIKTAAIRADYGTDYNSAGSSEYAAGVHSKFISRSAGSGIDNIYGFYSTATNPSSTAVTNQYGIYIADTGIATNNYGVYQAGSSFKNIFEGQVGIGTTNPSAKLHIARSSNGELLRLQDTSNVNQNYVFETEAVGTFYGLNIKNDSTGASLLNIGADQKIGIATNNPLATLHVNKQAANTHQILVGTNSSGLGIGHDSSGQQRSIIGSSYGNAASMISFTLGGYTTSSDKMTILGSGNVGIGTTSPVYKLDVNGGARAGGVVTYSKDAGSLTTTGYAVAGLTSSSNGNSTGFTFTCFGHTGGYQKIVYSCRNEMGTWKTSKVINEGTNDFDVEASADGTTITFTFKSTSGTKSYSPRVTIEASGHSINSTYA